MSIFLLSLGRTWKVAFCPKIAQNLLATSSFLIEYAGVLKPSSPHMSMGEETPTNISL